MPPRVDESLITYTHVIYALHALAVLIGITTVHTIVFSFVGGLPSIIAVIMNYARRSATVGTFLESHFRWQIRTFWFALLWALVAVVLFMTIIGIPLRLPRGLCARHLDHLSRGARLARAAGQTADVRVRGATLILAPALLLLAACGQKGPLYLPDKQAAVVTSAPAPRRRRRLRPAAPQKATDKDQDGDAAPPQ